MDSAQRTPPPPPASSSANNPLAKLPPALVAAIFALLPVDARARCAAVCRGWRCALDDGAAWASLDLSPLGVDAPAPRARITDALLTAACARARGALRSLDVRGCVDVSYETLLAAVAANGASLRRLVAGDGCFDDQILEFADVTALCAAAPRLETLAAPVICDTLAEACSLASAAPPLAPVRLHELLIELATLHELDDDGGGGGDGSGAAHVAGVLALCAALRTHPSPLTRLKIFRGSLADAVALDAVLDAALAIDVPCVSLYDCGLSPASAPALARLLCSARALSTLDLEGEDGGARLLDAPSAALLGAALRSCASLTALSLNGVGLWDDSGAAAASATLLGALTGHPRLRTLSMLANEVGTPAALAAAAGALGDLVAADAPALTALDVSFCELGGDGLGPLVVALRVNTHLRRLDVSHNEASAAFGAGVLLDAVRANGSLRELDATESAFAGGGGEAAMAHVRAHAAAAEAGAAAGGAAGAAAGAAAVTAA
jgi:hypothetical protein